MLLSICIPTYNRSQFLKVLVGQLVSEISRNSLFEAVELIISDNCSTDDTYQSIVDFLNNYPEVRRTVYCQTRNIGFVRNILATVELSNGDFWWFIGDDDFVPNNALTNICGILTSKRNIHSVFIFRQANMKRFRHAGEMSLITAAEKMFYYIGNKITVANTELSKRAIEQHRNSIVSTCWPQTHIYFHVMNLAGQPFPVLLSNLVVFEPQKKISLNNVTTSFYHFDSQFLSLFKLGRALSTEMKNHSLNIFFPKGVPFVNFPKVISWAFLVKWKLVFFDYPSEKVDFQESLDEASTFFKTDHNKYFKRFIFFFRFPIFFIHCVVSFRVTLYQIAYSIVKERSLPNPFLLWKKNYKSAGSMASARSAYENVKSSHLIRRGDW